jgi:hypothetical protein
LKTNYPGVLKLLLNAPNARESHQIMYGHYEKPADWSDKTYTSEPDRLDYTAQAFALPQAPAWLPQYDPQMGYAQYYQELLDGITPAPSPANGPGFGSAFGPEPSYPGQIDGTQSTNTLRGSAYDPHWDVNTPEGWTRINEPWKPELQPGGKWYYPEAGGVTNFGMGAQDFSGGVEPAGFGDFGMAPIGGVNPHWDVNTPEGWTRINEPWKPELQPGGIWYVTDDQLWGAPEGWGGGGGGGDGAFSPGDSGDAITNQHHEYMNAARAAAAKEAQYQAGVQAQRASTDASIAQNYATSNSYNPQYNGQQAFDDNQSRMGY